MPALENISIEGFKSIRSVEKLALRDVNILVGANGSGKSNFIEAFSLLHAIREGRLQNYIVSNGGANNVLYFGSRVTLALKLRVAFEDEVNQYEITLAPTDRDELVPISEAGYFWNKASYPTPYQHAISPQGKEAGISAPQGDRIEAYVRQHLGGWRVYHFNDTSRLSPMKRTADVNDNDFLRPDASNLPAFLYLLRINHRPAYRLIQKAVQRVAPFFDDFALEPERLNREKIRLEWRHKSSDAYFDVASLSDGTLRFIALATLFLQPEEFRPSVILVDEPELGLHPYAITMLASLMKQASVVTQTIVSTQSPILLDHFAPEDVLVAERLNESTELTRLEPERLRGWLEDYSLGQLWEKNEIGGRPGQG